MRLQNKVALVTGSGQGIGRATALTLAREGASIVLNDIVDKRLERSEAEVKSAGARALSINADVTQRDQVGGMVERAVATFGTIDVLVNNVGGGRSGGGVEVSEEEFKSVIDLNVKSQYLCCQAAVPYMQKQGSGKIVNVSSAAARYRTGVGDVAYAAAKAGVTGLTRFLASELGRYGITVNCVLPGGVLAEDEDRYWLSLTEEERQEILSVTPVGRLAMPQDVANTILALASDESSYITGVCVDVNGGWWMS